MVSQTRLKQSDREGTIKALHSILNRIPQCLEMPVREKSIWANAWNAKYPKELLDAMDLCGKFGYEAEKYEQSYLRFIVMQEGRYYTSQIVLDWLSGEKLTRKPFMYNDTLQKSVPDYIHVVSPSVNGSRDSWEGIYLSHESLREHLGPEHTESFLEWITSTASLRTELTEAHQTIKDILEMSKTAGQVKRMVPDLLQYLPAQLRKAYQEQIRASSLPFEWAPYPKDRVERLLVALNKGHLLAGMAKVNQQGYSVDSLDSIMWGAEVTLR